MLIDKAIAPSYSTLRPTKPIASSTFPVYGDPTVTHTLAVTAGYAYSDPETVSMMLARMGLAENHCLRVAMSVDAMFILSTAHLVQSSDGSVVILAYRGTEPTNPVNWLTDADVHPDKIAFRFADADDLYAVHAGFYRNVRAIRFEVVAALKRALEGRSVLDDGREASPMPPMASPMTTLYLTGHSLGGAMVALMAVMLSVEEEYVGAWSAMSTSATRCRISRRRTPTTSSTSDVSTATKAATRGRTPRTTPLGRLATSLGSSRPRWHSLRASSGWRSR
jgi:hypothetical protein